MPLEPDVLDQIDFLIRSGFEDPDRIVEMLCEELFEEGELDEEEVVAAVAAASAAHEKDKATWPAITDCDKLDGVFARLNEAGVIAVQYAGYTQSDGYDDVREIYHAHPDRERVLGYCFYHAQDLERAVAGEGLFLAFGPMNPDLEETDGPRVGALIAEKLKDAGLGVKWNGSFSQRILIPEIDWKRRGAAA
jgi:hypothetical protein